MLGISVRQGAEFREHQKALFASFLKLPDNHPIEIVEATPDDICRGCAIGKHCQMLYGDNLNSFNYIKEDGSYLDEFIGNLDLLNLPKPTISHEEAHFSDAGPQRVRRIRIELGIVKQVLKENNSSLWNSKS